MKVNPRRAAADIIYAVYKNDSYLSEQIKALRAKDIFSNSDIRFISEVTNGVIKNKLRIDYIISKNTSLKIKKIAPYILAIIECAVYQIAFMDTIPGFSAVNEAVNLTKTRNLRKSSGFVNAVLRNIERTIDSIEYPENTNEYLSVYYSFPLWLTERFVEQFGKHRTQQLLESLNKKPDLFFRANALKTTGDKLVKTLMEEQCTAQVYKNDLCKHIDYLVTCVPGKDITCLNAYKQGLFYVQDFAAALTVEVLDVKPGMTVVDMCAAPGGKTTHIAEKMQNKGKIFAFDMYEHKIDKINENAKRLGINIIEGCTGDATVNNPKLNGIADRILADVPCSGLGILRKKPDIKYYRKPEDIKILADIGLKILENAKNYVKTGGCIVFSTCTIDKTENDCVTDAFLNNNSNFSKQIITTYNKQNDGSITLYPDTDGCDGFYICKLIKNSD